MRVRAKALAFGGESVCHSCEHEGDSKVVFVSGLIPQEEGEVRITEDHRNFARAELLSVLSSSPQRAVPPCSYYAKCGGCNLQHVDLKHQRVLKLKMIEDMLKAQAQLTPKLGVELIGAELPGFHYRRRLSLHLDRAGALGFHRRGSRDVVDIEECLLANPEINAALVTIHSKRSELGRLAHKVVLDHDGSKVGVKIFLREDAVRFDPSLLNELAELNLTAQLEGGSQPDAADNESDFPIGHFSQVNPQANALLIDTVVNSVSSTNVTELYAGAGNFTIPLARAGKQVRMVEIDSALTAIAARNASADGLDQKIEIINSSAERFIKGVELSGTLLLDPPRSGAKLVAERASSSELREIVYVSCNLPSLCRDLKLFVQRGFTLLSVKALDMFPQTHHVELIALLRS